MKHPKTALRDAVHSVVVASHTETSLAAANKYAPEWLQEGLFRRVCPPPRSFVGYPPRHARRYGLDWELDLSDYFQWHQYFGFRDDVLDTILAFTRDAQLFVDVGANIGFYSACAARASSTLRVRSFEANPTTAAKLQRHVEMNRIRNVTLDCVGVAELPGEAMLRDHGGGEPGKFSLRDGGSGGHRISLQPLDALLANETTTGPVVIKIDVEGFEPEVILGARRFLEASRPRILFEWTVEWMHGKEDVASRARSLLDELGYRTGIVEGVHDRSVSVRGVSLGGHLESRNLVAYRAGDSAIVEV